MPPKTILDRLSEPNPNLDNENILEGKPTKHVPEEDIVIQPWEDFTFETLMATYGDVLRCELDIPKSSPISKLECMIFDEDSLDHLLTRAITPIVNDALEGAWRICYKDNADLRVDMSRGGRARKPQSVNEKEEEEEGKKEAARQGSDKKDKSTVSAKTSFPDWAGVRKRRYSPGFDNRCPGETKLASKWHSKEHTGEDHYMWPFAQAIIYVKKWNTRYAYIISNKELCVLRFSTARIGSGLAQSRLRRELPAPNAPQHHRTISVASVTSAASRMSIDSPSQHSRQESVSSDVQMSSSYQQSAHAGDMRPVEMKTIPWSNHGHGKLTVKLALWWIHMLAGAPGCDIFIGHDYHDLNTWIHENGRYQHVSTGIVTTVKPTSGRIETSRSPQNPVTPPRDRRALSSSPLSSPPNQVSSPPGMTPVLPNVEDITRLSFDKKRNQFQYEANPRRYGYFSPGTPIWSIRHRAQLYAILNDGQPIWVRQRERSSSGNDTESGESDRSGELPPQPRRRR
ncbi:predicted protein [Uncinocarpus reesii 1704]|uniref:Uncharacterized protein n=1 Tax=Uncinocarpus reesii (strain UAMH 1704) TaxID=336963 RepID=C4JWI0_UNCRE|nr:uncharacterized protein UREG_06922 [Uncinocarpus reesii 1704]EEP82057.1 predicted protein [Uncinocarpus reesii 1704]